MNQTDLTYYFEGNTFRKKFDHLNNGIKLFKTIKSCEIKLEVAKNLQNVFKLNLNEISKERFKSEEQKSALKNIELL